MGEAARLMTETIIVGVLSLIGTLFGAYLAHRKSTALFDYRLKKLEEEFQKHNAIVEKTYRLQEQTALHEAELKRVNHRLEDLEKKGAKA